MFLREKYFLQFIAYSEDKKQKFQIIKCINHNQYFELKKNCNKYITRSVTFGKVSIEIFKEFKDFHKKISRRKSDK